MEQQEETFIALNTPRAALRMAAGLLVLAAVVALFVVAAVDASSTGRRVGASVVAALFLAVLVALAVSTRYVLARRGFVIGRDGLRYESRRLPWRFTWAELRTVYVEAGRHRHVRTRLGPRQLRSDAFVRLVVEPDTATSTRDQPHLQRFRGKWGAGPDGYGIPLGPMPELAAPLDAALRAHAGAAYGPLRDLGEIAPGLL